MYLVPVTVALMGLLCPAFIESAKLINQRNQLYDQHRSNNVLKDNYFDKLQPQDETNQDIPVSHSNAAIREKNSIHHPIHDYNQIPVDHDETYQTNQDTSASNSVGALRRKLYKYSNLRHPINDYNQGLSSRTLTAEENLMNQSEIDEERQEDQLPEQDHANLLKYEYDDELQRKIPVQLVKTYQTNQDTSASNSVSALRKNQQYKYKNSRHPFQDRKQVLLSLAAEEMDEENQQDQLSEQDHVNNLLKDAIQSQTHVQQVEPFETNEDDSASNSVAALRRNQVYRYRNSRHPMHDHNQIHSQQVEPLETYQDTSASNSAAARRKQLYKYKNSRHPLHDHNQGLLSFDAEENLINKFELDEKRQQDQVSEQDQANNLLNNEDINDVQPQTHVRQIEPLETNQRTSASNTMAALQRKQLYKYKNSRHPIHDHNQRRLRSDLTADENLINDSERDEQNQQDQVSEQDQTNYLLNDEYANEQLQQIPVQQVEPYETNQDTSASNSVAARRRKHHYKHKKPRHPLYYDNEGLLSQDPIADEQLINEAQSDEQNQQDKVSEQDQANYLLNDEYANEQLQQIPVQQVESYETNRDTSASNSVAARRRKHHYKHKKPRHPFYYDNQGLLSQDPIADEQLINEAESDEQNQQDQVSEQDQANYLLNIEYDNELQPQASAPYETNQDTSASNSVAALRRQQLYKYKNSRHPMHDHNQYLLSAALIDEENLMNQSDIDEKNQEDQLLEQDHEHNLLRDQYVNDLHQQSPVRQVQSYETNQDTSARNLVAALRRQQLYKYKNSRHPMHDHNQDLLSAALIDEENLMNQSDIDEKNQEDQLLEQDHEHNLLRDQYVNELQQQSPVRQVQSYETNQDTSARNLVAALRGKQLYKYKNLRHHTRDHNQRLWSPAVLAEENLINQNEVDETNIRKQLFQQGGADNLLEDNYFFELRSQIPIEQAESYEMAQDTSASNSNAARHGKQQYTYKHSRHPVHDHSQDIANNVIGQVKLVIPNGRYRKAYLC